MTKAILLDRAKRKTAKGLPLTEEEKQALLEKTNQPKKPRKRKEPVTAKRAPSPAKWTPSPKDKAKYAIEQKGGTLWMQKWIDWDDKEIPVGKRRVAYVRYLTMTKGYTLDRAKLASKKFIQ